MTEHYAGEHYGLEALASCSTCSARKADSLPARRRKPVTNDAEAQLARRVKQAQLCARKFTTADVNAIVDRLTQAQA